MTRDRDHRSRPKEHPLGQVGRQSIYGRSPSYHHWVVAWAEDLTSKSTNDARRVCSACRGILRSYPCTARSLVPHLVVDFLTADFTASENRQQERGRRGSAVLDEILSVLKDLDPNVDSASKHHLSSQVVNSLIDNLRDRLVALELREVNLQERCQHQPELAQAEQEMVPEATSRRAVEHLLRQISTSLLSEAAARINAHARARRYYET